MKDMKTKIIIIIFLLLLTVGCAKRKNVDLSNLLTNQYNLSIDNNTKIDDLNLPNYSLEELNTYFTESSLLEIEHFALPNNLKSLEEVNTTYKIPIFRYHNNTLYSLYKVKQGGYYYVFFDVKDNKSKDLLISDTIYIKNLLTKDNFKNLQIGLSTYLDVQKISEATELFNKKNTFYSYSLLANNKVLVIEYLKEGNSKENLIIKRMKEEDIASLSEDVINNLHITNIYSDDLPSKT